ncbi:hypothetical protein LC612_41185 [Nostoc sp. CHAB 5834]|nr:hypothetical protein [Nostoc sp. CHAB 5834]
MFYHNFKKYDFWPIYNSIKKYYPIGVSRQEPYLDFFQDYPGWKQLQALIEDKIFNPVNYENHWVSFEKKIQTLLNKPVIGTTFASAPSFSAFIELERSQAEDRVSVKELYFTVSVLGPYYTIIGRDRTLISLNENHHIHVTNFLTISPENEYADPFELLCSQINIKFPAYRFVPFHVLNQKIDWLNIFDTDEQPARVYHAVFNDQLDLSASKVGNEYYRFDDWIKEGYQGEEGKWVINPPIK